MYVWVGIDVDNQLEQLKEQAQLAERQIGFTNSNFTLPLHVSLKISFQVDEQTFSNVVQDICNYYQTLQPFDLVTDEMQDCDVICWLKYHRNEQIDAIHDHLNDFLQQKYGVGLHPYDTDYKYHTTLFMEQSAPNKVHQAYEQVKNCPFPPTVKVKRFLVGVSPNGQLGTYYIYRSVEK